MSSQMLLLSHGSPMLALEDSPARRFLQGVGRQSERPGAVVVISAHWEHVGGVAVGTALRPDTIHDFSGFPRALYAMHYDAPGVPELAQQCLGWLAAAGIPAVADVQRGLDHGAWIPLSLMFPAADIPVCQVSLVRGADAHAHYRIGQALQPLLGRDVLVIGSGSVTHNLYEAMGQGAQAREQPWSREFADWLAQALLHGRTQDVLAYRERAPWARRNHPSEEHLAPLFVLLGMAGDAWRAEQLFSGSAHGVIAMDCHRILPAAQGGF